jgi:methionyl-tRNA synthetase
VLTHKYYGGFTPERSVLSDDDRSVISELNLFPDKIAKAIHAYRFREAVTEVINLARLGNKYLAEEEPWKLVKTDEARTKTILNIALQVAANLSIISEPFMPFSAKKLGTMLGLGQLTWKDAGSDALLVEGSQIEKAELLFRKIEDTEIENQLKKLEASKLNNQ